MSGVAKWFLFVLGFNWDGSETYLDDETEELNNEEQRSRDPEVEASKGLFYER